MCAQKPHLAGVLQEAPAAEAAEDAAFPSFPSALLQLIQYVRLAAAAAVRQVEGAALSDRPHHLRLQRHAYSGGTLTESTEFFLGASGGHPTKLSTSARMSTLHMQVRRKRSIHNVSSGRRCWACALPCLTHPLTAMHQGGAQP